MPLERTPWVDRNLRTVWDRIAERVPAEWLPQRLPGKRFSIEELGCGHYGCVAPTNDPDVVFKLTSDATEARFVAMALELDKPEGIVQYHKIFALEDGSKHRGRPLFVLWRQAAQDIGFLRSIHLDKVGYDDYEVRNLGAGAKHLNTSMNRAREAKKRTDNLMRRSPRPEALQALWNAFESADTSHAGFIYMKGIPRIGVALRMCWDIALELANTDMINPIGEALGHYIDEGILLADVHLNNIGRDKDGRILITDPGHAVVFHPQWAELPEIERI